MSTDSTGQNMRFYAEGGRLLNWGNFGTKIKKARLEKGLTQLDLSKIVGVTPESISYYESGKKVPSFEKIKTICKVLNLDINTI